MPQCSLDGRYYEEGIGCVSCHPSCKSCYGLESNNCLECPLGTRLTDGTCKIDSYFEISTSSPISPCSDLLLTASIGFGEHLPKNITYNWMLTSTNSRNSILKDAINKELSKQSTKNVIIPFSMLEPFTEYTFSCWYTDFFNQNVSSRLVLRTAYGETPSVHIEGGTHQIFYVHEENKLEAFIFYSQCLDPKKEIIGEWTQIEGPPLLLSNYKNTDFTFSVISE